MSDPGQPAPARREKNAAAFRTIGEVAEDLDLPTHVLRFWESKFPQLKPLKRGGGRRYYRPEDVLLLRQIRQCLYQDGYTIRGVQRLLGGPGDAVPATTGPGAPDGEPPMASLFPLAAADPDDAAGVPRPGPAPRRRPTRRPGRDAETTAALEQIRRELQEARAQLEALLRRLQGR